MSAWSLRRRLLIETGGGVVYALTSRETASVKSGCGPSPAKGGGEGPVS
jgi:hypothetical protein